MIHPSLDHIDDIDRNMEVIVGKIPTFLLWGGSLILAGIALLLLLLTWFISYPEGIEATIQVYSSPGTMPIQSEAAIQIYADFGADDPFERVQTGQHAQITIKGLDMPLSGTVASMPYKEGTRYRVPLSLDEGTHTALQPHYPRVMDMPGRATIITRRTRLLYLLLGFSS